MQGNDWQAPDAAQHGALFVILAAHLMPRFPPHYVVYQTEQWGHAVLAEGNRVWGPPHNGTARRDCAAVFRNAVEARPCNSLNAYLQAMPTCRTSQTGQKGCTTLQPWVLECVVVCNATFFIFLGYTNVMWPWKQACAA